MPKKAKGDLQRKKRVSIAPARQDRNTGSGPAARVASRRPFRYILRLRAGIAQLVERQLPKLDVAGSNPVARSTS